MDGVGSSLLCKVNPFNILLSGRCSNNQINIIRIRSVLERGVDSEYEEFWMQRNFNEDL